MKIGRITLSDRASSGVYEDLSGPEIERVVLECLDPDAEFLVRLLPDEQVLIEQTLIELTDQFDCALVITTGGTGPALRDVTPEATRAILDKELPGFGEIMRVVSFPQVPTAILSRATAGVRGNSLIINLPGQPQSIETCLQPLRPAVAKCLSLLRPKNLVGTTSKGQDE